MTTKQIAYKYSTITLLFGDKHWPCEIGLTMITDKLLIFIPNGVLREIGISPCDLTVGGLNYEFTSEALASLNIVGENPPEFVWKTEYLAHS